MKICFDMDGTIANFYGVNGWLEYLQNFDDTPYRQAKPLLRMSSLAKVLNIFNQVLVMCTEITYSKVDVIQTYAYRTGIEQMRMGYSMAVSVFKAIISLVLVLSTNAIAKKISDGEEGVF